MDVRGLLDSATTIAAAATALATVILAWVTYNVATATKEAAEATVEAARGADLQLQETKKNTRGDFLLRLDEAFRYHQDAHIKLRPGGDWTLGPDGDWIRGAGGPTFPQDGPAIEGYMGLFERVWALHKLGLIDIETIDGFYGYRLFNIVANPVIYEEKLVKHADGWRDFIALWRALETYRQGTRDDPASQQARQRDARIIQALSEGLQHGAPSRTPEMAARSARLLSALRREPDDASAPVLIHLLGHRDADVRAFSARALSLTPQSLRTRASTALTQAAREDPNDEVRLWAQRTLQFYGQPAAKATR
jgi:hypothetical protein